MESLRLEQSPAHRRRCDSAHRARNDSRGSAPPLRRVATTARPCARPPSPHPPPPPPLDRRHLPRWNRRERDPGPCDLRSERDVGARVVGDRKREIGWGVGSGAWQGTPHRFARGLGHPKTYRGSKSVSGRGREPVCSVRTTHTDWFTRRTRPERDGFVAALQVQAKERGLPEGQAAFLLCRDE